MEFPREELLEKYVRIYEEQIAPYEPDFEVAGGTTRYVRFNDAWRKLNPFEKLLIPKVTNRKNTFPKSPSAKIPKNGNPANYVTLKYDAEGNVRAALFGDEGAYSIAIVYISRQLTVTYTLEPDLNGAMTHSMLEFEWYEYDSADRLVEAEIFRGSGSAKDDVIINAEYYEYDGDVLAHAWQFTDFQKYPMQMTAYLVQTMMPDRIFNPNRFEYVFERTENGLDYTCSHYFRKSQTFRDAGHISEETLAHLAANGLRLV